MAPRQLLLELEEVDMAADKGPKRVRVDRADESSTQMVSSSFDPFLPTAAELAGDAPADEPQNEQPSERQDEKPRQEPNAEFKEALGRFDQSQHYLLIFTQVTNGQPFVRIDPVRFAPPRPNALGRRGILRFYKFFFIDAMLV